MNTNATIEKMQKMRLNGMKRAYESSFETRNQDSEAYHLGNRPPVIVANQWNDLSNKYGRAHW